VAVTRASAGQQSAGQPSAAAASQAGPPGWLVAAVPAVAELIVGGYRIGVPSLWRDEAATISGSQRPISAIGALTLHQDAVHGLYYLLIHLVIGIGGTSATVLRLPSLIAMSLAAGLTAVLGRRLAGVGDQPASAWIGLLAGLALVAVPLTTRYAQEARPYALTTLCAVAASYLLVRGLANCYLPWWLGYAVVITLTGLFNLFAVLIVVAHGLSLLAAKAERQVLRRWLAASLAAGLLLAPLAVLSARQSAQLNWVTRPGLSTVAALVRDFAGSTVAIAFVAVLAVLGCLAGPALRRDRGLTLPLLTVPWLVVPPVVLLAVSFADPVYVERYVVFCLPALSLLIAAGLVGLVALSRRALGGRLAEPRCRALALLPSALLVLALAAVLIGPQRAIRLPDSRPDNLRAVAATLSRQERPGDAILYLPWDTALVGMAYPAPFDRLRDLGQGSSPIASQTLRGLPASPTVVTARLHGVSRVWVVRWSASQPAVGPADTALLTANGFHQLRRWSIGSVILSLYVPR
jgi:mannosyltransferase